MSGSSSSDAAEKGGGPLEHGVGQQSAETERLLDRAGELDRRLGGLDSCAAEPRIALDEHRKLPPGVASRVRETGEERGVVDGHRDPRALEQRRQPPELVVAEQVVRDQHVVETGVDHDLRLPELLTRDPLCTELDLHPRDLDALVSLYVRPVAQAGVVAVRLPTREVALEAVEVDDRRGRVDH